MGFLDLFTKADKAVSATTTDKKSTGILKPEGMEVQPRTLFADPYMLTYEGYGYKEKFGSVDWQTLRDVARQDAVVAAVLQTRINQVASFAVPQFDKYKMGFKVQLRDKEASMGSAAKKKAKEIEFFLLNCGVPEHFEDTPETRKRDYLETFLRKVVRDSLNFDQLTFEIIPRKNGLPHSFYAVDASTIRLVPDRRETSRMVGNPTQSIIRIVNDMTTPPEGRKDPKYPVYAQLINGRITATYDEWELAFGVRNPRTDIYGQGYGLSEVEMLITAITSHLNGEMYNQKFFSQGSVIKGILSFEGSIPPSQLESFRRAWHAQVSGVTNAWRTPILNMGKDGKLNWVNMHMSNRDMEFGQWMEYCIKLMAAVFQIDPLEFGFDIARGAGSTSSGLTFESNNTQRLTQSRDKGLAPLLRFVSHILNDYIVWRIDPDFEFEFSGLNAKTEEQIEEGLVKKVTNYMTVNEIRELSDLKPLPDIEDLKNPGDIILNSNYVQVLQQLAAANQPQEGMPGAPGMPGMPGEQKDGQEGDQKPSADDYDNMSDEQLQAELDRLQGGGKPTPKPSKGKPFGGGKDGSKTTLPNGKQAAQSKGQETIKSLVLEL